MRILHTADWHIGRTLGGYSLLEDQAYFLEQMLVLMQEEKVDLLLVAGDLYQQAAPSAQAVSLLNRFFTKAVKECNIKIFIIAGNHDSAKRIGFLSELLGETGIYFAGEEVKMVRLKEDGRTIAIHMLPFISPSMAKMQFPHLEIQTYQEAMVAYHQAYFKNRVRGDQEILLAHGNFLPLGRRTGDTVFEASELSVGNADAVDLSLFDNFEYIALGHIHKPKKMAENAYFSGAPLAYSIEEADLEKQVRMVELLADQPVQSWAVAVKPLRRLKTVQGSFEDLMQQHDDDYVSVELTDTQYVLSAMGRFKENYPHILNLRYLNEKERKIQKTAEKRELISPLQMFEMFYQMSTGEEMTAKEKELFAQIVEETQNEVD